VKPKSWSQGQNYIEYLLQELSQPGDANATYSVRDAIQNYIIVLSMYFLDPVKDSSVSQMVSLSVSTPIGNSNETSLFSVEINRSKHALKPDPSA